MRAHTVTAAALLLAVPPIATAETVSRKFSSSDQLQFRPGLCIVAATNGTMEATRTARGSRGGVIIELTKPRIAKVSLAVWTKSHCNDPRARDVAPFRWVAFRQHFYGFTCSFNPSFSIGKPWSAGVSITPDCGGQETGNAGTRENRAHHRTYFSYDTSVPISWGQRASRLLGGGSTPVRLCASASATVKFRLKGRTTSETFERPLGFDDPCVYDNDRQ